MLEDADEHQAVRLREAEGVLDGVGQPAVERGVSQVQRVRQHEEVGGGGGRGCHLAAAAVAEQRSLEETRPGNWPSARV